MISDEAISVACEHVRYCAYWGMSPAQIIEVFTNDIAALATWDDAVGHREDVPGIAERRSHATGGVITAHF